jgi:hypothetical protein
MNRFLMNGTGILGKYFEKKMIKFLSPHHAPKHSK